MRAGGACWRCVCCGPPAPLSSIIRHNMTKPLAQIIDLGFSVADAESVQVSYENQTLSVSFVDWQEKPVACICRDTLAFRWQEAEYLLSDGERYDSAHEIIGSAWLRQHQEQGMTWEGTAFH